MRQIASREMLDQDLIRRDLREQRRNARSQHCFDARIDTWHNALGPEIVTGVVFAFPLPVNHLLPLGMVKPLFSRNACLRKLLTQPKIERTTVAIARHGQDGCVVSVFLVEQ